MLASAAGAAYGASGIRVALVLTADGGIDY
jgi:hypothetical protein